MRSIFLHDPADLDAPIPGGVQLCSREFLEIVRAASEETTLVPVTVTRAPLWRLRRRLGLGSYLLYRPEEARVRLAEAVARARPTHVFLNRSELLRLAPLVAALSPGAKTIVMSHGNQSGDDLYEAAGPAGRRSSGFARLASAWRIGLDLVTESAFRHRHLAGVCVMSDEEDVLERWLGARRTLVLPRIVRPDRLAWQPVPGRVGFVGTLDHTPNRAALEELCARLSSANPSDLELRLVGGPKSVGRDLAAKHSFVRYLGRLDDAALRTEAATWSLFLNPIFWLSRGASMKLGQALAWGLPTLTTRTGARGYRLAPGQVCRVEDSPDAFVGRLLELLRSPDSLAELHRIASTETGPDAVALGRQLKETFA